MTKATQKTIALLVLAALWFSALSPTMASVLFAGRADVLGRMLGAAANAQVLDIEAVICHQYPQTSDQGQPPEDSSPGKGAPASSHHVYCSFCLAPGAGAALPPAVPVILAVLPPAAGPIAVKEDCLPGSHRHSIYHSRAPPAILPAV